MNEIRHGFERIRFTREEKADLAVRLRQAAERQEEEPMTNETKRKVRKFSRGAVISIAAALTLTAGAVAAAVSPGLRSYFDARTPEDQTALEQGIYRLDRSLTYNGWTVTLDECVGDDCQAFLWVDVTAPEGLRLKAPEGGTFESGYRLDADGISGPTGGNMYALEDENDRDNRISFCIEAHPFLDGGVRGNTMDITLDPIVDTWVTGKGKNAQTHEGGPLTDAIRDHSWVFEDVELNYPDQSIRLEPKLEVPYLDGTATLACVEISPMTAVVRVEGGSCYHHHTQDTFDVVSNENSDELTLGDVTILFGGTQVGEMTDCHAALDVEVHMKDGTVLPSAMAAGSECDDSSTQPDDAYVEKHILYVEENSNLIPDRVIDPAQVDHVTVCGVDVPVILEK